MYRTLAATCHALGKVPVTMLGLQTLTLVQSRVTKAYKPINLPPASLALTQQFRATHCPYGPCIGQDMTRRSPAWSSHLQSFGQSKGLQVDAGRAFLTREGF